MDFDWLKSKFNETVNETLPKLSEKVMETTSKSLSTLQQSASALSSSTSKDPNDVAAKLQLTFLTPRLIAGVFPCETTESKHANPKYKEFFDSTIGSEHIMIWNLSELSYEGLSALEFKFPGHPSAPLSCLFELCVSLDSWLDADRKNVAMVHCLTGKGRTLTILACYLAWSGEFKTPQEALEFACKAKGMTVEEGTIPSQRRYVEYFSRALEGVRCRLEPILLKSARVRGATKGSVLQLYVDGALISNSNSAPEKEDEEILRYEVNSIIDGDTLLRIRREDPATKQRVSIFRVALHSGYTPVGSLILHPSDLDGGRDNTWIELNFEPVKEKSKAPEKLARGVATTESAFWELIARRRQQNRRKFESNGFEINENFLSEARGVTKSNVEAAKEEKKEETETDQIERELGKMLDEVSKTAESAAPAQKKKKKATNKKKEEEKVENNNNNSKVKNEATVPPAIAPTSEATLDELEEYLKQI